MEEIKPFPLLTKFNVDQIEEKYKSSRPNFIKKIKKGEYLKNKK
jgi:hypothetical protein